MKRQWIYFALIFIAILPILLLRDFTADNELKYLSIADEAIENSNIFAFYNHGAPYADKPPLYLWFVMLGKIIFGKHVMFYVSLLSVIPAFVTAWIMGKFTGRALTERENCSTQLMLFTTAFFLAPIIVLRMDMLMTMFITLALYTFYRMYEYNSTDQGLERQARLYRRRQWLLPLYIFLALFSKGPVGLMLPLLAIIVFLAISRRMNTTGKYLGWRCWTVLLALCALWFTGVYLDGGSEYLNNLLFHQTIDRAVDAFHHKKPIYYYLVTYWFTLAPWSLLAFAAIITAYKEHLVNNTLSRFFITIFLTTLVMLSLISSKLEIYLLPAFPFLVFFTATVIVKKSNWALKASVALPAAVFMAIFAASCFYKAISEHFALPAIELAAPLWCYTLILFAGGVAAILSLCRNRIFRATDSIAISLLLFIFSASLSISSFNKYIGMKEGCKVALEKAEEHGFSRFVHYNFHTSENFDVYFKEMLGEEGADRREIEQFAIEEIGKEDIGSLHGSVLFLLSRHIAKDPELAKAVEGRESYRYGMSTIVLFE